MGGSAHASSKLEGAEGRRTTVSVAPGVLYFATPGLGLGATLRYSRGSQGELGGTAFGIGPTVSYYLGGADAAVHPFASLMVGWGRTRSDSAAGSRTVDETLAVARMGVLKLLVPHVGLTFDAFYERRWQEGDFGLDAEQFGLTVGLDVYLFCPLDAAARRHVAAPNPPLPRSTRLPCTCSSCSVSGGCTPTP